MALGTPRTVRIHLPLLEPVVGRIGVDEDAGGAALFGGERLEAAIAVRHRVADQRDFSAHVDAVRGEPVVVRRVAAVRVDDRRRHVARRRVCVVRDADVSRRERIAVDRFLFQRRVESFGRDQVDGDLSRIRQQDFVLGDLDLVEPVLAPPFANPVGEHPIARRPGDVRLGGQVRVRLASVLRRGERQELCFEAALGDRGARGETVHARLRLLGNQRRKLTTKDTKDTKH